MLIRTAQNFIQSSCHSFLNKLLNGLRVSLALVWTTRGANHQLLSKTIMRQMLAEQPWSQLFRNLKIVNLYMP